VVCLPVFLLIKLRLPKQNSQRQRQLRNLSFNRSSRRKTKRRYQIQTGHRKMRPNNAINTGSKKRRSFVAPPFAASYSERWASHQEVR